MISNLLLGHKYTDIKILLDKIRSIEKIKKDIIGSFLKQKKPFILKFNSQKSSKKSGMRSRFTTGSTTSVKRFATIEKSTKSSAGIETNGSKNCTHSNSRFESISKKPER